jgi:hypothetical protein
MMEPEPVSGQTIMEVQVDNAVGKNLAVIDRFW